MKQVYLYAFDSNHKCRGHKYLEGDAITMRNIKALAKMMRSYDISIRYIYAVDNRPGLQQDFKDGVYTNDFVEHIAFEDLIKYEGIRV